ncbi:conserved hypothetical protein [Paraburkholderia piptadeniae]|uniref:Uncharacterized protein n=1 Tax=Paraburkholderia piptadeniae TaxID=1701573 RepID=A0A1N7ST17_9BURK|nr:hypothetical protein [Paraburkholderia piptadeniae]SIT50492.1 conserved hypothetical protein [Paraburkholderia piptadeniae]
MPGTKKPRKPFRPSWNRGGVMLRTQPWKVAAVFGSVEKILDQLDTDGTITTAEDGTPLFRDDSDQCFYEMAPSLRGLTDAFDLHSSRNTRPVTTAGLLALLAKLEAKEEVDDDDIAIARESVRLMRAESMNFTADYANQIVRDTQIKFELERLAA